MKDVEGTFEKVFGEKAEETLKETSEEANKTRAKVSEAVLGSKEVEERSLDHWC